MQFVMKSWPRWKGQCPQSVRDTYRFKGQKVLLPVNEMAKSSACHDRGSTALLETSPGTWVRVETRSKALVSGAMHQECGTTIFLPQVRVIRRDRECL